MNRALLCSAALLSAVALPTFAQSSGKIPKRQASALAAGKARDRFIVQLRAGAFDPAGVVRGSGGNVVHALERLNAIAAKLPPHVVELLKRHPQVAAVLPDPERFPLQSAQWADSTSGGETKPYGLQMIQADQVSSGAGSRTVCVIDSGYDMGHEDLPTGGVTANSDAGTGDPLFDGAGHGTHVAGTIAALASNGRGVRGIAHEDHVRLHIVKVFNNDGVWAYSSDLIKAVERCRAAGANIINMSLGGPYPADAELRAMSDAFSSGVLLVAAAGNDADNTLSYPAGYSSVISVAAVDSSERVADFSQRNMDVELAAPGVNVLSTVPGGYDRYSGTSMATPHVAGAAALLWSHNTAWSNGRVREALQRTARDKGTSGRDSAYGYGIVQVKSALGYLNGFTDTQPPKVSLVRPRGGEKAFTKSAFTIEWTASDNQALSSFTVQISTNGGSTYSILTGCGALSGSARSCTWSAPAPVTGTARIRVIAKDKAGNSAQTSSSNFSIVSGSAALRVTSPNTAVKWTVGSTQTLRWSHNLGAHSAVHLDVSRDGGTSWSRVASGVKNSSSTAGSYVWAVTSPASTAGRIRATWSGGTKSDSSDVNFTIAASGAQSPACAAPAADGINVCSPAAASRAASPVSVNARAKVGESIYRFELWANGVKVISVANSGVMQQSLALSPGNYRLEFVARNAVGARVTKTVLTTVQ
jgi:serine protease